MYSESRQFLKKKKKSGRRIYVERVQKLKNISSYSWNDPKLGFTSGEREYFLKQEEYCSFRKTYVPYYEFKEPWRFTLRTRPNMITHYKPVDFQLEKEIAELKSYLGKYKVAGIINKTIHGRSYSWNSKKEDTHLIKSRKYFRYKISATEVAESFLDDTSII
ncbi:Uncharacterised protein [Chryseobacterium nakagawai]|nr:Uncharacterised protein [Chryseobacterium nakagawai]